MHATIKIRDGKAYAVSTYHLSTAPILRRLGWLLNVEPECVREGDSCSYRSGIGWDITIRPFGSPRTVAAFCAKRREPVREGAEATIVEEEPIPCPKVRKGTETRWSGVNGQWEKYLASRGWVPA